MLARSMNSSESISPRAKRSARMRLASATHRSPFRCPYSFSAASAEAAECEYVPRSEPRALDRRPAAVEHQVFPLADCAQAWVSAGSSGYRVVEAID